MFCEQCGMELEDDWVACPNCGKEIKIRKIKATKWGKILEKGQACKEWIEYKVEEDKETYELSFVKCLLYDHPIRAALCIPVILYLIYTLISLFTGKRMEFNLVEILQAAVIVLLCGLASWLIYGPINFDNAREKAWGVSDKVDGEYYPKIGIRIITLLVVGVVALKILDGGVGDSVADEGGKSAITQNETSHMSIQEYLDSCIYVTNEELARNPDFYVGKDIVIDASFNVLLDSISINDFEEGGGVNINYEGKAVDMQGYEIGNVLTGDHGAVAGKFGGKDDWGRRYIDAVIIIIDKEYDESI